MKEIKKTKIVATVGPASDSPERIGEMIGAGADVFRFNTKHSTIEWHNERIKRVQRAAEGMKRNIGIMVDLQGSEIRIETEGSREISVRKGDVVRIASSNETGAMMAIPDNDLLNKLRVGDTILIDDGYIELRVSRKIPGMMEAEVVEGGTIKDRKSLNFPGSDIKLSSLIKRDLDNLDSAAKNNVNFVALSFVSSAEDIRLLKKEMEKRKMKAMTVAKIENQSAIDNIDEIIDEADSIMIARGDLGIEIPIESLAFWQKEIIKKCRQKRKPVIVATQMLHSMISSSRPTRAEATDVANAVLDGTDAVMLSEETAMGKYPVKSIAEMAKIVKFNERNSRFEGTVGPSLNPTEFVVGAVAGEMNKKNALDELGVRAVIVFTESGYTARVISAFRPKVDVAAITNNKEVAEILSLSYGITGHHATIDFKNLKIPTGIANAIRKESGLKKGDTVAVFHGRYEKNPELLNLFSLSRI